MMSLERRLNVVVSLLPPGEKERFAAPLAAGESTDSRLVDAVAALAKAEGLAVSRSNPEHTSERAMPEIELRTTDARGDDESPEVLASQFAVITDPRAQTAFWRSLTAEQRAAILNAK
jgi:hypothetical protein